MNSHNKQFFHRVEKLVKSCALFSYAKWENEKKCFVNNSIFEE